MRKIFMIMLLSTAIAACKKDAIKKENFPNGYYPEIGDSSQLLIEKWGKPNKKELFSPSFNDNGNWYYADPINRIVKIMDNKVESVRKQ
jgi:hypothetical protein